MKISYAITVCNELTEIQRLLSHLLAHKREEDEIVVLYDSKNGSKQVEEFLRAQTQQTQPKFYWTSGEFNNHFADWKNKLTSLCTGDYIFQIDADEFPHVELMENLPEMLEGNSSVDVFLVPRVNTVSGLTETHIQKWGWNVNNQGWVNWPDYQWRIYKNNGKVKWINKVHEKLADYKEFGYIPNISEYALYHPKDIERQERQNNYYDELS